MINPHFKTLTDTAKLPSQAYQNDAGTDLYLDENFEIPAHGFHVTNLGISWNPQFEISPPQQLESIPNLSWNNAFPFIELMKRLFKISMILKSRSGLSTYQNIEITTGGVVDEGYIDSEDKEAPFILKIYNNNDYPVSFKAGDKICQGLILLQPNLVGVPVMNPGKRGARGLGSTGKQ